MARAKSGGESGPAIIKRRISKPGPMTIPTENGVIVVKEGDEVTAEVRKAWEEWQRKANSEGNININVYTS